MLTHYVHDNPDLAKAYFLSGLIRSDYSIGDQEFPGIWRGKTPALLGLTGTVKRAQFDALCDNIHPTQGIQLTPRTGLVRRIAYDLCFAVPKSVSVIHGLTDDPEILDAVQRSVLYTMDFAQQELAQTRVRKDSANTERMYLSTQRCVHLMASGMARKALALAGGRSPLTSMRKARRSSIRRVTKSKLTRRLTGWV